jgi:hypothetical protein
MHTSTRLSAADFQFWRHDPTGVHQTDFLTFFPAYQELDRIGVVSPNLEEGVYHTGYALLALTTAFYDSLRAGSNDFFDYPQHFAFVGAQGSNLCTGSGLLPLDTPNLWQAWSWLDVWPDNKWVTAPASAAAMLQRVFDYQINRLFWPRSVTPTADDPTLPPYLWKMLRTRLKSVYYYGALAPDPSAQRGDWIEVRAAPGAATIVQESLNLLPEILQPAQPLLTSQIYERVRVEDFLAEMNDPMIEMKRSMR